MTTPPDARRPARPSSMSPERWQIVDTVVQGALALTSGARAEFLTRACGSDEALRREVEAFLDAVADDDFLERRRSERADESPTAARRTLERVAAVLGEQYAIEREIGHGGMATVFLARDLRQRRQVAVKVLRPELSMVLGAGRFLREIELTASFQHPHILPLFDSGSADGLLYYVMPYVAGESLRARIARERQLPVADAVRIATEVASALEYAHRHGVVHRDVKPENVLLAEDGSALVADFGIALAVTQAADERLTETGLSLGTPQYMAPEQAMAERDVDGRVDVYALGAVTYEMLAGEPPFTGPSTQAIAARVLTDTPRPLTAERPSVPPHVESAVRTALEKLPADRFTSARAFADALADTRITSRPHDAPATPRSAPARRESHRLLLALATLLTVSVGAAAWRWLRPSNTGPDAIPSRLAIVAPDLAGFSSTANQRLLALTPAGDAVVYVARRADGQQQLALRPLDALSATVLAGHEGIGNPVVAPDGRSILATVGGSRSAYRYALPGGGEEPLMGVALGTNVGWDADGALWSAATPEGRGLARFDAKGVSTRPLAPGDSDLTLQQILPDGRHALVMRTSAGWAPGPLLMVDLRTGTRTPVMDRAIIEAHYAGGYLVYVRPPDRTLLAAAFDPASGAVGESVELATDVGVTASGTAQVAVAPNGTVAYVAVDPFAVVIVGRDGAIQVELPEHRKFHGPKLSPDGRRIAVHVGSVDGSAVWVLSLDDSTLTRATFESGGSIDGVWSRDGEQLTYMSGRNGVNGIYRKRLGATAEPESLFAARGLEYTGSWLHDESAIVTVMSGMRPGSGSDIAIIRNRGHGPAEPLLATSFNESYPAVSPDDRWLAYVSDGSGREEVYARPLRGDGEQVQISRDGGTEPLWSRDGRELFYRSTAADAPQMISVGVRADGRRLQVLHRRALFSVANLLGSGPHANYDVTPDGRGFVMLRYTPPTHIMVIQHLPELVERLRGRGPVSGAG
jgi:serine/threonine-protein kinase